MKNKNKTKQQITQNNGNLGWFTWLSSEARGNSRKETFLSSSSKLMLPAERLSAPRQLLSSPVSPPFVPYTASTHSPSSVCFGPRTCYGCPKAVGYVWTRHYYGKLSAQAPADGRALSKALRAPNTSPSLRRLRPMEATRLNVTVLALGGNWAGWHSTLTSLNCSFKDLSVAVRLAGVGKCLT